MLNLVVAAAPICVMVRPGAQAAARSSHPEGIRQLLLPTRRGCLPIARLERLLLFTSMGTAVASFIYEIDWIRMLALVLGSATHSFELMLSAFILGLAFGAWWIRGRADRLRNPLRTLGLVQWTWVFSPWQPCRCSLLVRLDLRRCSPPSPGTMPDTTGSLSPSTPCAWSSCFRQRSVPA